MRRPNRKKYRKKEGGEKEEAEENFAQSEGAATNFFIL